MTRSRQPARALRVTALGLAVGVATVQAAAPAAASGWSCATAVATAYRFNPARQRWQTLILPVDRQSFVIRPGRAPAWELVWTGGDGAVFACEGDPAAAGGLQCGGDQLFTFVAATPAFSSRVFGEDNGSLGAELVAATISGACTPLAPPAAP